MKRKINWFHVFILVSPFILILSVVCIFIGKNTLKVETIENELQINDFSYLTLEVKEEVDIEEFTSQILSEIAEKKAIEEQSKLIGVFRLTGYDDCYECQEEYVGTTALGVTPQPYHTIAVDPGVIPLGSHVIINGIEYVAEDVGGGVGGNHIDIFVSSHAETYSDYCNGYAEVYWR